MCTYTCICICICMYKHARSDRYARTLDMHMYAYAYTYIYVPCMHVGCLIAHVQIHQAGIHTRACVHRCIYMQLEYLAAIYLIAYIQRHAAHKKTYTFPQNAILCVAQMYSVDRYGDSPSTIKRQTDYFIGMRQFSYVTLRCVAYVHAYMLCVNR